MTCDRAEDRTLLLSLGLFGVPAGRGERACEMQARDERERAGPEDNGRTR